MHDYKPKRMRAFFKVTLVGISLHVVSIGSAPALAAQPLEYSIVESEDLIDVTQINNHILVHLVYSTTDNFLHEDVYGDLETCYLRREVAEKLANAQVHLEKKKRGFRLIVYDGLRPRDLQYKMWRLVKGTPQQEYVADPEQGSIHNFGAAVDVSIVDEQGNLLDMGTPFDYFGERAQPHYEKRFLKEGKLTQQQVDNRKLLRKTMEKAGFNGIPEEWWHFNAFPLKEAKRRYRIVEILLPLSKINSLLQEAENLPRDKNGFCVLVKGSEKKLYLIEHTAIKLVFDVALGEEGVGKTKEGDRKTPSGDYNIKWMVSRNGPPKENPGGVSSFVVESKTYAVLDTELYFGELTDIRVKVLPDGTRKVSGDTSDRPITTEELKIAQDEKLWTDAYGGENVYVMALDYPTAEERAQGKTGSCIEIHASLNLEKVGHKNYRGTLGCITLYPTDAKKLYHYLNPGTKVRITQ